MFHTIPRLKLSYQAYTFSLNPRYWLGILGSWAPCFPDMDIQIQAYACKVGSSWSTFAIEYWSLCPFFLDTATGNLLNKIQCSSGVTGIQFNETLKHMATSHGAPALGPTPATNSIVSKTTTNQSLHATLKWNTTNQAPGKDGSIQFWELMKMANPSPTDAIKCKLQKTKTNT